MKVCPRCSETNNLDAPICRRCHAPLDTGARVCPSGRHMMDPSWTECAYCKSDSMRWTPNPDAGGRRPTVSEDAAGFGPTQQAGGNVPGFPGFPMPPQGGAGGHGPGASGQGGPPWGSPSQPAAQFGPGAQPPPTVESVPESPHRNQTMSESQFRRALGIASPPQQGGQPYAPPQQQRNGPRPGEPRIEFRLEPRAEDAIPPQAQPAPQAQSPSPSGANSRPAPPPQPGFGQPYDPSSVPPFPATPGTQVETASSLPPGSRRTMFVPPSEPLSPQNSGVRVQAGDRRIIGVLITYTWRPEGQIFPVREGRNLIGRDPERCDIAIPEDATLSAINSHISYRRNFVIGDSVSMGGTDVNDVPVEEQFVTLPNYARIRTGSTHWTFIMAQPAVADPAPVLDVPEVLPAAPAPETPKKSSKPSPHLYE